MNIISNQIRTMNLIWSTIINPNHIRPMNYSQHQIHRQKSYSKFVASLLWFKFSTTHMTRLRTMMEEPTMTNAQPMVAGLGSRVCASHVTTLRLAHHMHKAAILWKFQIIRSWANLSHKSWAHGITCQDKIIFILIEGCNKPTIKHHSESWFWYIMNWI